MARSRDTTSERSAKLKDERLRNLERSNIQLVYDAVKKSRQRVFNMSLVGSTGFPLAVLADRVVRSGFPKDAPISFGLIIAAMPLIIVSFGCVVKAELRAIKRYTEYLQDLYTSESNCSDSDCTRFWDVWVQRRRESGDRGFEKLRNHGFFLLLFTYMAASVIIASSMIVDFFNIDFKFIFLFCALYAIAIYGFYYFTNYKIIAYRARKAPLPKTMLTIVKYRVRRVRSPSQPPHGQQTVSRIPLRDRRALLLKELF